jgi:hypothetical protein
MAADTSAIEQKIFELKSDIDNHLTANLEQAQQNLAAAQASGNAAAISKAQGQIATVQTSISSAESQLSGAEAQLASAQAGGSVAVSPTQNPEAPKTNDTPINAADVNTSAAGVDYNAGLAAGTTSASDVNTSATAVDPAAEPAAGEADSLQAGPPVSLADVKTNAYPVANTTVSTQTFDDGSTLTVNSDGTTSSTDAPADPTVGAGTSANSPATAAIQRGVFQAQQQSAVAAQRGQQQQSDWRVRLQLAPGATYLYNDPSPGILQPLKVTNGIIFPYTPKIETAYKANYQTMDLTHSNYKGYFYQNSYVEPINITAHFTAQSTSDANYVLAVIHFFRSVTKMFYGQDAQRGSPPPLVYLSGLGQYQFNSHPCVVSSFTYSLPDDVDYIRAQTTNQAGLNLTNVNSNKQSVATNTIFASLSRLANAFTNKGALPNTPFGSSNAPNLAQGSPTYVPTKMDISITLLPVMSRQAVSQQFSLKQFANGNQQKGGFW